MVESQHHNGTAIIVLQPNRSATWAETKVFVLVICSTTLIIGAFWAFIGAWMVLPFSGLEAALVAFLFYRVCQSTYQRQVITCSDEQVIVQFGTHFPKRSWQLERKQTRLRVSEATHALAPLELLIADATHSIELGKFLNKEDKELAVAQLRQAGLPVRRAGEAGQVSL